MRTWLAALGLLLIFASAAHAQQASLCAVAPDLPGAWEATDSVPSLAQEWLLQAEWMPQGAVQSDADGGLPTKIRTQARIGFRHRNPHLGILHFNPEPGRDMTGTRHADGYIVREEIVQSILKPSGPGPPAPVAVTYPLSSARQDRVRTRRSLQPHFQSGPSRSFLRRV
jgi:hypothetical protein